VKNQKTCDLCGDNQAELKVRQVDKDGKATEIEVCAECARRRGFAEVGKIQLDIAQIVAEMKDKVVDEDAKLVCDVCKMTFADFKRQGRAGCAHCFVAFDDKLEPLVRRVQGAAQHVGRAIRSGRKDAQLEMSVERLDAELKSAIQAENYEKAAGLRDQLSRARTEQEEKDTGVD